MRISLRELMLVVAAVAVGMAGLKYASSGMLPVVQAMTGVILLAMLVRAIVDRGRGQAFAIGFLISGLGYALVAHFSDRLLPATTWPVYERKITSSFPPTQLWLRLCPSLATYRWINTNTGKPLNFDPTRPNTKWRLRQPAMVIEGAGIIVLTGPTTGHPVLLWDHLLDQQLFTEEEISAAMIHAEQRRTCFAFLPIPWPSDLVFLGHCYGVIVLGYAGGRIGELLQDRTKIIGRRTTD
jgi:hypothetical protein